MWLHGTTAVLAPQERSSKLPGTGKLNIPNSSLAIIASGEEPPALVIAQSRGLLSSRYQLITSPIKTLLPSLHLLIFGR